MPRCVHGGGGEGEPDSCVRVLGEHVEIVLFVSHRSPAPRRSPGPRDPPMPPQPDSRSAPSSPRAIISANSRLSCAWVLYAARAISRHLSPNGYETWTPSGFVSSCALVSPVAMPRRKSRLWPLTQAACRQ